MITTNQSPSPPEKPARSVASDCPIDILAVHYSVEKPLGVYYSLAYGVALTDQFGGQYDDIPNALMEFAVNSRSEKDCPYVQSMPTVEDYFLVMGVDVPEGATGLTWEEGTDYLKEVHEAYLSAISQCPKEIQDILGALSKEGRTPRLTVLAGNF